MLIVFWTLRTLVRVFMPRERERERVSEKEEGVGERETETYIYIYIYRRTLEASFVVVGSLLFRDRG